MAVPKPAAKVGNPFRPRPLPPAVITANAPRSKPTLEPLRNSATPHLTKRMAAHVHHVEPFIHFSHGRLMVSRCGACGLVVAASPYEHVLLFAENYHVCPVYMNYGRTA
jgi:hypothetical protein